MLRDSRDRSEAANKAFTGAVPRELMDYLQKHRDTLAPELREAWAANGSRASGTWEEVFGSGKQETVEIPIQTLSPPLAKQDYDDWRRLRWSADEFFMAWNYARYVGKVAAEGKPNTPSPCS